MTNVTFTAGRVSPALAGLTVSLYQLSTQFEKVPDGGYIEPGGVFSSLLELARQTKAVFGEAPQALVDALKRASAAEARGQSAGRWYIDKALVVVDLLVTQEQVKSY